MTTAMKVLVTGKGRSGEHEGVDDDDGVDANAGVGHVVHGYYDASDYGFEWGYVASVNVTKMRKG